MHTGNCERCGLDLPKGTFNFCPECGHQFPSPIQVPVLSNSAVLSTPSPSPPPSKPLLIELTAKKWKLFQLIGSAISILGTLSCTIATAADSKNGPAWGLITMAGLAVFIFGRIGAWWHHG